MKLSLSEFLGKLPLPATKKWPKGVWDITAFARDEVSVLLFTPRVQDYQTPHSQDELYVIVRGKGTFVLEDKEIQFETGDALFVPARAAHRFVNFTDDLAAWVVFWGPHHGEKDI
jgi:mannose-6-phosphate isomerase-like protein (cupin superfamily)